MTYPDLSRFTVVIPTFSRPHFVIRQFEYWRETTAQVVILDGAPNPVDIPVEKLAKNIRYIHSGLSFNQRLADAWNYINTEFCALLPDDEFFLPLGVDAVVRHLDKHPRTIGCVGRCLYFFVDQNRFLMSHAYRDWKPFPDVTLSAAQRFALDLPPNKTHMTMYGIFRFEHWRKIFETSCRTYFSCGYAYERLMNLQRSALGRTDVLDDLLWMRSKENPPVNSTQLPRFGRFNFVSWAKSSDFELETSEYRRIALGIIQGTDVTPEQAIEFEQRFFEGGIIRQESKEKKAGRSLKFKITRIVLRYTPYIIRQAAKRYLPSAVLRYVDWEGYGLRRICSDLDQLGTRFNLDELRRVQDLSLKLDRQLRSAADELSFA